MRLIPSNRFQEHRLLCMGVSPDQRRSHDHRDREPLPAGGALTCSERSEAEKERGGNVPEIVQTISLIFLVVLALKTIIGIHLPWERCDCCGEKWRDIRKQKKESHAQKEAN